MNFSLHNLQHKAFLIKNNSTFPKCFEFFFFQLIRLFRNIFQSNLQDSRQMLDTMRLNWNVHFIHGNTGRAGGRLTVKTSCTDLCPVYHCLIWACFHVLLL